MVLGNDYWEWEDYFLATGEKFISFWDKYLSVKERNILFILGVGFDPRMCVAVESIMARKGDGKRDCLLINFDEGESSPSQQYQSNVSDNLTHIKELFNYRGIIKNERIIMVGRGNRRTGSRNAANLSLEKSWLQEYTDIIVDISARPRILYFPLIKKLLYTYDNSLIDEPTKPNIHVVVAENPFLDSKIKGEGIEDKADYIHGFRGDIELESTADIPRIWLPLIG